jgi:hypothetical protein
VPIDTLPDHNEFAAAHHGLKIASGDTQRRKLLTGDDAVVGSKPGDEERVIARHDDLRER